MRLKPPLIAAAVISGAFGLGFGGAAIASAATTTAKANVPSVQTVTRPLAATGTTGNTGSSSTPPSSTNTTHKCPNMGSPPPSSTSS